MTTPRILPLVHAGWRGLAGEVLDEHPSLLQRPDPGTRARRSLHLRSPLPGRTRGRGQLSRPARRGARVTSVTDHCSTSASSRHVAARRPRSRGRECRGLRRDHGRRVDVLQRPCDATVWALRARRPKVVIVKPRANLFRYVGLEVDDDTLAATLRTRRARLRRSGALRGRGVRSTSPPCARLVSSGTSSPVSRTTRPGPPRASTLVPRPSVARVAPCSRPPSSTDWASSRYRNDLSLEDVTIVRRHRRRRSSHVHSIRSKSSDPLWRGHRLGRDHDPALASISTRRSSS